MDTSDGTSNFYTSDGTYPVDTADGTYPIDTSDGKYTLDTSKVTFFDASDGITVKILKFRTPQTIAIIVLQIEKFDVTLH